jgi:hypothetical protein
MNEAYVSIFRLNDHTPIDGRNGMKLFLICNVVNHAYGDTRLVFDHFDEILLFLSNQL